MTDYRQHSHAIRVFPRRTRATPVDSGVRIGGPGLFDGCYDKIRISVSFTWDIAQAERIASEWKHHGPVEIGGPALDTFGVDFTPGEFIREGYVITSRGCPERCWFCQAWKRDGDKVRELPITDGWNVLDDNLLACSEKHIMGVFAMLSKQKRRVEFTGGLHAARLKHWHINLLAGLKVKPVVWLALDEPADYEPFLNASMTLRSAGFGRHNLRCYVLCGYPKDTLEKAENRMKLVLNAGADPMAMVFRDRSGNILPEWKRWSRQWIRPAIMHAKNKDRGFWHD